MEKAVARPEGHQPRAEEPSAQDSVAMEFDLETGNVQIPRVAGTKDSTQHATNGRLCVRFRLTKLFEIGRDGRKRFLDTFDLQKIRA